MMKVLNSAPFNEILEIGAVSGDPHISMRLRELGFRPGVKIQILGQAPFGGPLLVQIHSNVLALRKSEAECLQVL
jgi:ferrous iron transport protein A